MMTKETEGEEAMTKPGKVSLKLQWVTASELRANERNWRRHPDSQREVLSDAIDQVGFAVPILARPTDDGLVIIDGHLRQDVAGDDKVPVIVADVTEEQANLLLATMDPIAAMAETDGAALRALYEGIETDSEILSTLIADVIGRAGVDEPAAPGAFPEVDPANMHTDVECPACGFRWSAERIIVPPKEKK